LVLPLEVEVAADIPYTSQQMLDVYAPTDGTDWPVVVYFHGGNPDYDPNFRKNVEPEARAIAEQGVVVYVPTWNGNVPAGGSEDTVCAIAFAHATAAEHGGDPARLTPAGYSAGGYDAVIHAFIGDDPPLPVTDCVVDPTIPAPNAVIGGASPLFVADWAREGLLPSPEWTALTPEQIDAFDPYLAVAMQLNPGLQITLVVGEDDVGGNPNFSLPITESNVEFDQALQDAGYEAELRIVSGGHLEPQTPGTEQFQIWVDTIVEVANGVS
jgi:acetyl esterase/lipase